MKKFITEADVEENVLDILKNLDYDIIRGQLGISTCRKFYIKI